MRVYKYENSTEYRLYDKPVSENQKDKSDKPDRSRYNRIEDEDGTIRYVSDTGVERAPKDTERTFRESQKRSKQKIIEYARANTWNWFLTFTLSSEKVDRYNYDDCYNKLRRWLENVRKRKSPNMKYLIVPEQHKDGAYHFHGLLADIDIQALGFELGKVKGIYSITSFKLGFSAAMRVKDTKRVSTYICKYITKQLCDSTYGRHRYIKSANLAQAEVMDYNITPQELQALKIELIADGAYYKQVKGDYGISVTYINMYNSETSPPCAIE